MANHQCRYNNILTEPFLRQRYLEDGTSANAIAQEVGINAVTVRQYLQRYHIPLRTHAESKHTPVDYAGFDNLSDDWHAYWIGFLAADGCVYVNEEQGHAKVNLSVEASDIAHLQRFQQGLQTAAKVHVRSNGGGYNHHGKVAVISISNPHLVRALAKWGIVPQKSLSLAWPIHFPAHLIPAYIRGYFDGDGTIYLRHRLSRVGTEVLETVCRFTSGSLAYLEALQKELSLKGIKSNPIYRNQQSNTFVLPLSSRRENLLVFSDLIYHDCTVYLERKRAIFQEMEVYHAQHPYSGLNLRFQAS